MFKRTSENTQSRERRLVVESRQNTGGVENYLKRVNEEPLDLRSKLSMTKALYQNKISKVNAQIALARRKTNGQEVSWQQLKRWEAERANLVSLLSDIDLRLTGLVLENKKHRDKEDVQFRDCFLEVAKEMLIPEIYKRLCTAAIHRMKDRVIDQSPPQSTSSGSLRHE